MSLHSAQPSFCTTKVSCWFGSLKDMLLCNSSTLASLFQRPSHEVESKWSQNRLEARLVCAYNFILGPGITLSLLHTFVYKQTCAVNTRLFINKRVQY